MYTSPFQEKVKVLNEFSLYYPSVAFIMCHPCWCIYFYERYWMFYWQTEEVTVSGWIRHGGCSYLEGVGGEHLFTQTRESSTHHFVKPEGSESLGELTSYIYENASLQAAKHMVFLDHYENSDIRTPECWEPTHCEASNSNRIAPTNLNTCY